MTLAYMVVSIKAKPELNHNTSKCQQGYLPYTDVILLVRNFK